MTARTWHVSSGQPDPCSDFRPAIPLAYADSLCRCGVSRTGNSHGDGYIRTIDITGVWARVVAEHRAEYHPGRDCPDPDGPCVKDDQPRFS